MRTLQAHRAYTLLETVVSLAVAGVLMTGLGSTILLANRALPGEENPSQAAGRAAIVIGDIVTELLTAKTVTERSATTLEFTVADRDNDANPETIRYSCHRPVQSRRDLLLWAGRRCRLRKSTCRIHAGVKSGLRSGAIHAL